jgi:YVTN family beta-propeller protein
VSAYAVDSATGALTQVPGSPFAAGEIPVAAVARKSFLYVGNSYDKTISQYSINATTGVLTPIAQPFSTGNSGPLGLTVSPDEPLLYVADHDTDQVIVLGFTETGLLFNESSMYTRGSPLSIALASGDSPISYSPKFVYECNASSDDIWGYQVTAATGSLETLGGSPFAAGSSPQSVISDLNGSFVFAANPGSNNVSAFAISQTGALVPAPGSPYSAGTQPSSVAVDNGAHYVYVTNAVSNTISGYSVSPNGALAPVPGSPFADSGTGPQALFIDPRGKFVYVANGQSNTISVFEIDPGTGTLQSVASVGAGSLPLAVTVERDGKYLYALNQSSQNISAFGIDPVTGELTPLAGSPFGGAGSSNSLVVDPLGKLIYAGSVSTIIGYKLFDPKGNLSLLRQSPFGGVSEAYGLSIDQSESFLFAANNSGNSVSVFQLDQSTGDLTPINDSPFAAGTNPTSVTVVDSIQ